MNNFIKQVIEEKFASKSQQRFFYAKANEKGSSKAEKKKWGKMAKEFSDDTDYEKIPEKKEKKKKNDDESQFDEIIDVKGNIQRSKELPNASTKGITQNRTSDEVAKTGTGQMGSYGGSGAQPYRRHWGEADMSKSLGYKKTLGQDTDLEDAEDYFEKELGMDDNETNDRLSAMGYDPNLPDDKVRLVENPKKFIEEYIESLMNKKTDDNDLMSSEIKEINPIVKKQIKSLKNTMNSHNLSIDDIIKHLKDNE
jgi:hypothetical protein